MGRRVDLDDLVDATEIAHRFGVAGPSVVHDWRRRHSTFPQPIFVTTRVRLWLWPDVEAWGRSTHRL